MSATPDQIHKYLESNEFDEGDKAVIKWQFGLHGDFYTALWEAIIRADDKNLMYLSRGFPTEVRGYIK